MKNKSNVFWIVIIGVIVATSSFLIWGFATNWGSGKGNVGGNVGENIGEIKEKLNKATQALVKAEAEAEAAIVEKAAAVEAAAKAEVEKATAEATAKAAVEAAEQAAAKAEEAVEQASEQAATAETKAEAKAAVEAKVAAEATAKAAVEAKVVAEATAKAAVEAAEQAAEAEKAATVEKAAAEKAKAEAEQAEQAAKAEAAKAKAEAEAAKAKAEQAEVEKATAEATAKAAVEKEAEIAVEIMQNKIKALYNCDACVQAKDLPTNLTSINTNAFQKLIEDSTGTAAPLLTTDQTKDVLQNALKALYNCSGNPKDCATDLKNLTGDALTTSINTGAFTTLIENANNLTEQYVQFMDGNISANELHKARKAVSDGIETLKESTEESNNLEPYKQMTYHTDIITDERIFTPVNIFLFISAVSFVIISYVLIRKVFAKNI